MSSAWKKLGVDVDKTNRFSIAGFDLLTYSLLRAYRYGLDMVSVKLMEFGSDVL